MLPLIDPLIPTRLLRYKYIAIYIVAYIQIKASLAKQLLYHKLNMLFSYFLCCQTSMSAMLHQESVMSMPTVKILLVPICVRANLDTVEMEKHAKVRMVYST